VKRWSEGLLAPGAIAAATLLAALAWPSAAAAEGSAGADELFRQGVRALREGRYDDATSLFRLSYEMEPQAATMCNLALTHERAGRDRDALEAYRRCAEDDTTGRYRGHALERADELQRRLGATPEPLALRQPQPRYQPRPQPRYRPQPQPQAYVAPTQPPGTYTPQPRRRSHTLSWVGLGVGVLSLGCFGGAIGLHVWATDTYDYLTSEYEGTQIPEGSGDADMVERGGNAVNGAIALYVVGSVLGGVALVLFILDAAGVETGNQGTRIGLRPAADGLALVF
jgi:tetratricopeptide (TPR) repeat protein